jgi:hypothetical protein
MPKTKKRRRKSSQWKWRVVRGRSRGALLRCLVDEYKFGDSACKLFVTQLALSMMRQDATLEQKYKYELRRCGVYGPPDSDVTFEDGSPVPLSTRTWSVARHKAYAARVSRPA